MTTAQLLDGALFALGAVPALGAVAAACLATSPGTWRHAVLGAGLFAAGAALARLLPDTPAATACAAACMVLGGGAAALGASARRIRAAALPWLACGVAAGWAAGLPTSWPAEAVGSVLALAVLAATGLLLHGRPGLPPALRPAGRTARRVAGAWLAALGALLLALWWRGPGA